MIVFSGLIYLLYHQGTEVSWLIIMRVFVCEKFKDTYLWAVGAKVSLQIFLTDAKTSNSPSMISVVRFIPS